LMLLIGLLLVGCGIQLPTPLPTLEPTATQTPTPTIIWFPFTMTPTVLPTLVPTPTPDLRPGLGDIIVKDDFSTGEAWLLRSTPDASVAIANNHITLALSLEQGFLFSLRTEPVLEDFYVEITASPNLCGPEDEYGLMIRTTPALSYYRFAISCDGRAKLVKVSRNSTSVLVSSERYAVIPSAAPSSSRLAVWASGEDIRFFVNNQFLFSIRDTILKQGTLGVFVRIVGEKAVSVNYSDLVIYQVSP